MEGNPLLQSNWSNSSYPSRRVVDVLCAYFQVRCSHTMDFCLGFTSPFVVRPGKDYNKLVPILLFGVCVRFVPDFTMDFLKLIPLIAFWSLWNDNIILINGQQIGLFLVHHMSSRLSAEGLKFLRSSFGSGTAIRANRNRTNEVVQILTL